MRKKSRSIIITMALVIAMSLTAMGISMGAAAADVPDWTAVSLEDSYDYNELFTVPERSCTVSGETQKADCTVVRPDGTATTESSISLAPAGKYRLIYGATVGGKRYYDEVGFTVNDSIIHFTGHNSTYRYGKYDKMPTTNSGLLVNLADGESLELAYPIDVNEAYANGENLVTLFATPVNPGSLDFSDMEVVFTDSVDPSITLTLKAKGTSGYQYITYCSVGGNGQGTLGYEGTTPHFNDQYGKPIDHSFYGVTRTTFTGTIDSNNMALSFNPSSMQFFANNGLVADLDDTTVYGLPWYGFPSGRCKMTITASGYAGATAGFCILELAGTSDLGNTVYVDTEAPDIIVDAGSADITAMPTAKVGGSYPLPAATAFDAVCGAVDVSATVWYNYAAKDNGLASMVPIENGRFATNGIGSYAIVYEATDYSGNKADTVVWVEAEKTVPAITVSVDDSQAKKTAYCGERVSVPSSTASVSGGSNPAGVSSVLTVEVEHDGVTETLNPLNAYFTPESAGTYKVKIVGTDYIGETGEFGYDVTVTASDKPIIPEIETVGFPACFISCDWYSYTMPEIMAKDYSSGTLVEKPVTVTITDKDGAREIKAGEKYMPLVANPTGDTVKVELSCGSADKKSAEIPAIVPHDDNGKGGRTLKLERYLQSYQATVTMTEENCTIAANGSGGTVVFLNPLLAEGMRTTIAGVSGQSNFGRLNLMFVDSLDNTTAVTLSVVNGTDRLVVEAGGNSLDLGTNSFRMGGSLALGYSDGAITVGSNSIPVSTTDLGDPFTGFPSGKIYVMYMFAEASRGDQFRLLQVDTQPMRTTNTDRIAPRVVAYGEYGGTRKVGDKVTLPVIQAADALTPDVVVKLTVMGPGRQPVTASDGTVLRDVDPTGKQFDFTIDAYGTYTVTITAADTAEGLSTPLYFTYQVFDTVAPEIKFDTEIVSTAKVGDVLVIPPYTVSDDNTAAEELSVGCFVQTPVGYLEPLPVGSNSIHLDTVGVYEVKIIVADSYGNVTVYKHKVTVTA